MNQPPLLKNRGGVLLTDDMPDKIEQTKTVALARTIATVFYLRRNRNVWKPIEVFI
jgi:hypothetical protein